MGTYFHGSSEIQAAADHGLQTLVLMNPAYVQYSSTPPPPPPPPGNLVFLNSTTANSLSSPHLQAHVPPPHTQQFIGIPLPTSASLDPNSQSMHAHHEISALHGLMPRVQYNLWNSIDPNMAARDSPRAQQGLSLSLSSQKSGFGAPPPQSQAPAISGEDMRISGGSSSSASGVTNGVSGVQSVVVSSKYLKAVQEILDEVVKVGNGLKSDSSKKINGQNKVAGDSSPAAASGDWSSGGKGGAELTTAERQEIQMKKAKLINMLEEVDHRYRQYHHQMQIVISSFEQAAGLGSAKTYTALALKTISKQFRCLKDAIAGQIRAANKNLGEEDNFGGKIEGSSRLKFVDHHLRQQRALQQLGMIQHNAWRPQRGLPEKSVSVLRAWLFEHFLHPYPKDSDKHMLAKQAGLTRSQVSNWFINARVRLWKPMVEEMYVEEIKEQEQDGSEDKTSKSEHNEGSASKSSTQQQNGSVTETQAKNFKSNNANSTNQNAPSGISISTVSTSPIGENLRSQSGFSFIGSSELEGITQGSPKKLRRADMFQSTSSVQLINMDVKPNEVGSEQISLKFGNDQRQSSDGGYSIMGEPTNFIGGFGHYPLEEIGRYEAEQYTPRFSGNGVSLTLGLPHCENLSLSGAHQNFLPSQNIQLGRGVEIAEPSHEFGTINTSIPHSSAAYESINIQNRKRFAAQLLPDFVA